MNITDATNLINDFRTAEVDEVTLKLTDGTEVTGAPISVNSKGVNLKIDGKVKSFSVKKIDDMWSDSTDDEADVPELHEGMTTAELASLFGIEPKELRVHLRSLGLGVGKGRKYALDANDYNAVKALVNKA